jgi:IclR family pca regulon transcriptional regulator
MSTTADEPQQSDGGRPPSVAAARTLTILEMLVSAEKPLTLTALAKTAGIPLASAAMIMQTLESRGYASRRVVGRSHFWSPSLRVSRLGSQLLAKLDLPTLAQPHLRELSDSMNLPAHVGVLDGADLIYVARATTPNFVQFNTYIGKTAPFNLTALGKAIAAHLPRVELNDLASRIVKGQGPKAKKDGRERLFNELAQVQAQGYAVEDEEEEAGIACIAAPIFDLEARVIGSVGVAGFRQQVVGEPFDSVVTAVTTAASRISGGVRAPQLALTSHHSD